MKKYEPEIIRRVCMLRQNGKTYGEIRKVLGIHIPKSTLSGWCKDVKLPAHYLQTIREVNIVNLSRARTIAAGMNKIKRQEFFEELITENEPVARKIFDKDTAKIALSMLCLGEASKYSNGHGTFYLGNSDPRIIILFLKLLKLSTDFDEKKVHCSVQCRADQNIPELEAYWQEVTGVPKNNFYRALVDPRTVGKPTIKLGYKGVLRVYYNDTKTQLNLESLADLVYNQVLQGP